MAQLGAGIFDELRTVLREEGPWLASQRRRVVGEVAPGLLEAPDDNPDAAGRPGSRANQFYDAHNRPHIMQHYRDQHYQRGEDGFVGSQVQQMLAGDGQSKRTCSQCTATTAKGTRCRKRTCRSGLCWQHLKRDDGLRIKPSTVPGAGLGLFATEDFRHTDKIAPYTGEQLTRAAIEERYGDERGEYVLCRDSKRCIDSRATNSSAARYANDSRGTEKRNNARFRALRIEASQRIRPGDEIFVAYGRDYWR